MTSKTVVWIGAAAAVVGLAAWEKAESRFVPDTTPGASDFVAPVSPPVRLESPLPGAISAIYVAVDASVKTGQALALIDSPEARARLNTAKADLEMERSAEVNAETSVEDLRAQLSNALTYQQELEAQAEEAQRAEEDARFTLDQRTDLYEVGAVPREERDSAERNHNSTRVAVSAAQSRLNEVSQLIGDARRRLEAATEKAQQSRADVARCEREVANAETASGQRWVVAPVDGKVTAVNTRVGQSVEAGPRGAALFEIAPSRPE